LILALLLIPTYLAITPPNPPARLSLLEANRIDLEISGKKAALEKLAHDASKGKPAPFTLVLREVEINRLLETDDRLRRAMQRESVERAWVSIQEGKVTATAIREGTPSSMTVTVTPRIGTDHRLRLAIDGMGVGRLGLPAVSAVRHAAEKAIKLLTDKSMIPQADFESVKVEQGTITLTGVAK